MNDIFSVIKEEITEFEQSIPIVPGFFYNQRQTIERIYKYHYSKFEESSVDENGYDLVFFNLSRVRAKAFSKNIDLDPKHLRLKAKKGFLNSVKSMIGRIVLRNWAKESDFASKLNDETMNLPVFGSYVVKKIKNPKTGRVDIEKVDLRNFINDQGARSLKKEDCRYKGEMHFLTPKELEEKRGVWNNVDKALDFKFKDKDGKTTPFYIVYERYGWIPESVYYADEEQKGDPSKYVYAKHIVIGVEDDYLKVDDNKTEGIVLHKELDPEEVYEEDHMPERIDGRWLGVGLVEELFEAQIERNEMKNWKRSSMRLASLQLYQTEGDTIAENILNDLSNGDILTNSNLIRVDTQERNLSGFKESEDENDRQADALTNAYEIVTGETPNNMPFRLGATLNANANKYFNLVIQQRANFWERIVNNWLLPDFKKSVTTKFLLEEFADSEDLIKIDAAFKQYRVKSYIKSKLASGVPITSQNFLQVEQQVGQFVTGVKDKFLEIPDDFFDFSKGVLIYFDDQYFDRQVHMESLKSLFQIVGPNPELLQHPVIGPIIYEIMETAGISPVSFIPLQAPTQQAPAQPRASRVDGAKPKSSLEKAEEDAGLTRTQTQ